MFAQTTIVLASVEAFTALRMSLSVKTKYVVLGLGESSPAIIAAMDSNVVVWLMTAKKRSQYLEKTPICCVGDRVPEE